MKKVLITLISMCMIFTFSAISFAGESGTTDVQPKGGASVPKVVFSPTQDYEIYYDGKEHRICSIVSVLNADGSPSNQLYFNELTYGIKDVKTNTILESKTVEHMSTIDWEARQENIPYYTPEQAITRTSGVIATFNKQKSFKDVGKYNITGTCDYGHTAIANTHFGGGIGNTTMEIKPLPITITAKDASKNYDGKPLKESGFTVKEKLPDGHKVKSVSVDGTITKTGTASNVASKAIIVDAEGKDVTKNFDITYKNGTLTVNKGASQSARKSSADKSTSPKTGDDSNIALFAVLAVLGIIGATGAFALKRREENN